MTEGRHDRAAHVPGWDQERLAAATAVLLGAGALGTTVAQVLALAGVGNLVVCDPDEVAVSNLSRCPLFREADVGRPKAQVTAAALASLAPGTTVVPRRAPLASGVGLAELRAADLVIACLDSRAARVELATRCNLAGAAMLNGGTHEWGGEVSVHSVGGRCFGCDLNDGERAAGDDPWSCTAPAPTAPAAAASAPVSALVGAWLGSHAIRLLLGLPVASRLRIDAAAGTAQPVAGPAPAEAPDPACPLHETLPDGPDRGTRGLTRLPVSDRSTVAELLSHLAPDEEPLTWAGFRRGTNGPCARIAATHRLRAAPPGARLRSLGVAPREVLPVAAHGGTLRYVELSEPSGDDGAHTEGARAG